jgi:hypothetical protein
MAAPVNNPADSIDEIIAILHATVDELLQLGNVVPAANIIRLKLLDPIEHTRDPLQFLVLLAIANGVRLLTEVNVRISASPAFISGPLPKVVVEFSEIADSSRLNHTPSPETAALNIRATQSVSLRRCVIISACFLALIFIAKLRRIGPRLVALLRVVPNACERELGLRSTEKWSWSTIPFGVRGGLDLHVRIYSARHVSLGGRALVILIALSELAASIRQRVLAIDKIPRVLIASIILDSLLHGLSKEGGDVDEAIFVTVGAVIAHEKVLVCHTIIVHHAKTIEKILIAIDS